MKFNHFFVPHPDTHQKAHLISWQAVLIYIGLFVLLKFALVGMSQTFPGVLGVASNVDQQRLIEMTNKEREQLGLPALKENTALNKAALEKAKNMFLENYWAHYSPSGKDPWGFIKSAGYNYSYAGENLARNFQTSDEVVAAWMASPTHKDNIVNDKYREIGIAVVNGVLKGEETTLVVQEFGSPIEYLAQTPPKNEITPEAANNETPIQVSPEETGNTLPIVSENEQPSVEMISPSLPVVNPNVLLKTFGLGLLVFMGILMVLDLYIMKKRAVVRLASRHLPHFAMMSVAASTLLTQSSGKIL